MGTKHFQSLSGMMPDGGGLGRKNTLKPKEPLRQKKNGLPFFLIFRDILVSQLGGDKLWSKKKRRVSDGGVNFLPDGMFLQ